MDRSSFRYRRVVQRLLAHEAHEYTSSAELLDAANRLCWQLRLRLIDLTGPRAFGAMRDRAVLLTQSEFPFLRWVHTGEDDCLDGLQPSLQARAPDQVRECLVAVLANLLGVVESLVLEDLTLRLIQTLWPDVPNGDSKSGSSNGSGNGDSKKT